MVNTSRKESTHIAKKRRKHEVHHPRRGQSLGRLNARTVRESEKGRNCANDQSCADPNEETKTLHALTFHIPHQTSKAEVGRHGQMSKSKHDQKADSDNADECWDEPDGARAEWYFQEGSDRRLQSEDKLDKWHNEQS